jgi:hypothetical protein
MKLAFLLLVLINLALFAWQQGVFGRYAESGREPERIARQIEADRFRVLSEAEVKTLRERATPAPRAAGAPLDMTTAQACVEFGDFTAADMSRVETALVKLGLGARQTARVSEVAGGYFVYLPPFKTRAEADKRLEELRKLGVRDITVIADGPLRLGLGLGSFRDAEAARAHLAVVEKSGAKGARVADKPSTISVTRFQMREIDAPTAAQIAAIQKEFPAQSLRPCPAG